MKARFVRGLGTLAGLAWIVFLSAPSPARADLVVTDQEDSGAVTTGTLASGSPGLFPGGSGATGFQPQENPDDGSTVTLVPVMTTSA